MADVRVPFQGEQGTSILWLTQGLLASASGLPPRDHDTNMEDGARNS